WLSTLSGTKGTPARPAPARASAKAIASSSDVGLKNETTTTRDFPSARAMRTGRPAARAAASAAGLCAALCTTGADFAAVAAFGAAAVLEPVWILAPGPNGWCLIGTADGE